MSGSELSFDLPIWSATIYHSERGATNPWNRAFNIVEVEDEGENELEALKVAINLFAEDFLNPITIYQIEVGRLIQFEEGGGDA